MELTEVRLQWRQIEETERDGLPIVLLGTFTLSPLVPYLGMSLRSLGVNGRPHAAPFNQIPSECASDASASARLRPKALVVWARLEEAWGDEPFPLTDDAAKYETGLRLLIDSALSAATRWKAIPLIVLPAIPELRQLGLGDASNCRGVMATASRVRERLRDHVASQPGALIVDHEEVVRALGIDHVYDHRMDAFGRIPYSEPCFDETARHLSRTLALALRPARKVIVVDADNTLWGGVIGEDGVAGLEIGDTGLGRPHRAFQRFLLEARRAGFLLALCSKNEPADVWSAFSRPEMLLRKEHLSAWSIGWEPKSLGLSAIAKELNVGTDSLVFIDDNPVELGEVGARLPGVALVRMPEDASSWWDAIRSESAFDRLPPLEEDTLRAVHLAQDSQRDALSAASKSHEEYLANLQVEAAVFSPLSGDLPRLAQLVQKTNQFNLSLRRRTATELASLIGDSRFVTKLVRVRDRFGDYGVVGAFILDRGAPQVHVDTFLLSCRAMGRGIEDVMVSEMFQEVDRNGGELFATPEKGPRNDPALQFFARLGCEDVGVPRRIGRRTWPTTVARWKSEPGGD